MKCLIQLSLFFFCFERIDDLASKIIREIFISMETYLDITPTFGNVGGSKNIIPNAEREPKIHSVGVLFWKLFTVMPYVHFWVVENVTQLSIAPIEIGMVEVSYEDCKHMNHKKLFNPKTYHRKGYILDSFINNGFHKMKTELCGKSHLFNTMMYFVKVP